MKSWGEIGSNDQQFKTPYCCAIYQSHIYITDSRNSRIQVFSVPDGNFVTKFNCDYYCGDICIYKNLIYVSYNHIATIIVYTLDGNVIHKIDCRNIEYLSHLNGIFNLCVTDEEIYLTVYNYNEIVCLSLDFEYKFSFNGKDVGGRKFHCLFLIFSTYDSLYVTDRKGIQKFDRNNNLSCVQRFKTGYNKSIRGMALIDDKCFITDIHSKYVLIYK